MPRPAEGEALVRVLLAGICDTDLQLAAGYMGFQGIPGHEFVGRVESAPSAPELVGHAVVGEINASCRDCDACRSGHDRHCPRRTVLGILGRDGAFAEFLALPAVNLHRVGEMPIERAVFVEPVAAALAILEQVQVSGRRALVLGCGKLGALCARALALGGAVVAVAGRNRASTRPLAGEGFSGREPDEEPRPEYDVVVEATGSSDGFPAALRWVRPRGTIVLKTTTAEAAPISLAPVVIDELTIVGSRCGRFPPAIEALAAGKILPERTIIARYSLDQVETAFAAARHPSDPGRRKIVLSP